MVNVNKLNFKKLLKKGACILVAGGIGCTMLTGCDETRTVSTNSNVTNDIIDTTDVNALENGIVQKLEVADQDYKLIVEYKCELEDNERWTITSDKDINMRIHTEGLPEGYEVYIDNVHTDTTILSNYPTVDGITQDTMDDRTHNSLMLGFPISNNNYYSGINHIEGQNDTFIHGTVMGFNGYASGSVDEKRFLEEDYLEKAVYGNKISSIIDLITIDSNGIKSCASVPSEVEVSVWPYIHLQDTNGVMHYRYYTFDDRDGCVYYSEADSLEQDVKTLTRTKVY